jgi:hypothetical protein
MDTLENPSATQSELTELKAQCTSLRQLLGGLLVLMIVISGTLNIYLWRQYRMTGAELRMLRPQVGQLVADYQRVSAPAITEFLKKLNDYEKTHPDFTPILVKYNLKAAGITGAVPASVPSAKK